MSRALEHLYTFPGASALSDFRIARLLARLQQIDSRVVAVHARYRHWIHAHRPLSTEEAHRLEVLLAYGSMTSDIQGEHFIVIPRLGTVSPWASKATDIAHNCGLSAVHRIERGVALVVGVRTPFLGNPKPLDGAVRERLAALMHDRMTESVVDETFDFYGLFRTLPGRPLQTIALGNHGPAALEAANQDFGLALSKDEISYLFDAFAQMGRDPTDVELMMFAQANSEHCRHKIFNAQWIIDGVPEPLSLFQMIRNTEHVAPQGTIVAYSDNAAIMQGHFSQRWFAGQDHVYKGSVEATHIVMKVETHNHPTAIAPFPGASTGAGGEIRDEGATGRGAKPKAGLTGFSVSHLRLPGRTYAWENTDDVTIPPSRRQNVTSGESYGKPERIASALSIMIDGPLGGAAFNNEFGRPNLGGYFRVYEQNVGGRVFGYHKPIMIAGGIGSIRALHTSKAEFAPGTLLIQLGGPGMRIGLGGGAASSMATGANTAELDFDSVQRGNPEMQRRAQEVIDRCCALGEANPILSIHDVGAGGLSNALPELVHGANRGGKFDLSQVPLEESGLSPMEIWSNESQERYVLAVAPERVREFEAICLRERCPFAVVGSATASTQLVLADAAHPIPPIDIGLDVLFGKPPGTLCEVYRAPILGARLELDGLDLPQTAFAVLRHPTVGDKSFLVTIGDRTVGGLNCRDQMVGPWQVPVADCAVTLSDYRGYQGEAMAMGERSPLAVLDAAAAARMAVGEALTNLAAAPVVAIENVKLSANWMGACGAPGQDAALFEAVKAVGIELCPALGIGIPVGKDSLSMRSTWKVDQSIREVTAPVSLVVTAFAAISDARRALTPQLRTDCGESELLLIDLGGAKNRLGGSILAQVTRQIGQVVPDVDDAARLKAFFSAIQALNSEDLLWAYHDRSDGGLFVTLCEMAFAAHVGVSINMDLLILEGEHASDYGDSKNWADQVETRRQELTLQALFAEELGAVIQIPTAARARAMAILREHGLGPHANTIGKPNDRDAIEFYRDAKRIFGESRTELQQAWSETSWQIARLRDNPLCADSEYARIADRTDPGMTPVVPFELEDDVAAPFISSGRRPRVAVLREQGVNSQIEMAFAFDKAGFESVDVHMSDLLAARHDLGEFAGFVACGGFSYGDVLGAGEGWAKTILYNERLREMFAEFFTKRDSFALGVCNGCQMMAALAPMIPGAADWPAFSRNRSERFEGRFGLVEITPSNSLFFSEMAGTRAPIAIAHGEGYADFTKQGDAQRVGVAMRYVDNRGAASENYPSNPNGSAGGLAGATTDDGRFTILMPHPERVFRTVQMSWHPARWQESSPWLRIFRNARRWVG